MHGGDIYRNKVTLDYSVNINPLGIPENVKKACQDALEELTHYPDITAQAVKESLKAHFALRDEKILCGNGASELIMAACHAIRPKKALLMAPGFYGYIDALEAVGAKIHYYQLSETTDFLLTKDVITVIQEMKPEMMFITNPNNPTGQMVEKEELLEIIEICKRQNTVVVVDECFFEWTEKEQNQSLIKDVEEYDNLFILRAFTKSFAIPGVRLGYAICKDTDRFRKIEKQLPEWNLSVIAQRAAVAALEEVDYLEETRKVISKQRQYLLEELQALGFKVYPSRANYMLFFDKAYEKHVGEGKELYHALLEKQTLIRDCSDYYGLGKGYYRVAVKTHNENEILISQIKEILKHG